MHKQIAPMFYRQKLKRVKGFTLIEMMIVVSIIGIIAAFAFPSYQTHVMKSRRADARATLLSLAQAMEERYTNTMDYSSAFLGSASGAIFPAEAPLEGRAKFYDLLIDADETTPRYFLLWAKVKAGGAQADDVCHALWVDSSGKRGAVNASGAAENQCWD